MDWGTGQPVSQPVLWAAPSADLLAQAGADGHLFEIVAKPVHPTVVLGRAAHLLSPISPEAAKTPEELD